MPSMFSAPAVSAIKPKSYNDFTKKFDNNSLKLGLRS